MSGKVAPAVKKGFLEELFGNTSSFNLGDGYLGAGLASSAPTVNSSKYYSGFVEPPAGYGCGREAVGKYGNSENIYFNNITYGDDGSVTIKNSKEIKFDTYRGTNALSIKYIVLYNGSGTSNASLYFALETPITLNPNELLVIPIGQASCKML